MKKGSILIRSICSAAFLSILGGVSVEPECDNIDKKEPISEEDMTIKPYKIKHLIGLPTLESNALNVGHRSHSSHRSHYSSRKGGCNRIDYDHTNR